MQEQLPEEEVKNPLDAVKTIFTNFEWGISLSVGGYLFLIFLGITYNFWYFAPFKINIFLFSEINDFLMAPLANPLVILFGLLSVGLVSLFVYLGYLWGKKNSKSYQLFYRIIWLGFNPDKKKVNKISYSPLAIGSLLTLYLFVAALYYAIYRNKKTIHDQNIFHYKLSIDNPALKNRDSLIYVGDNSSYYFLYDTLKHEATVIPKGEVKFVSISKNPKGKLF